LSIENSIVESIKSEKIGGLSADLLDLGMKAVTENDVLEQIPFFGLMAKSYNAAMHVRESLFTKKVYEFLFNIKELNTKERTAVIDDIASKKNGTIRAGEAIIALIDKSDDIKKPELIGKLFVACGLNEITVDQFLRLSNIITNLYLDDLLQLQNIYKEKFFDDKIKSIYSAVGLMRTSIAKPHKFSEGYSLKEIGEAVFDSGFNIEYKFTEEAVLISNICFHINAPQTATLEKFFK
jgi:hypothetical protein